MIWLVLLIPLLLFILLGWDGKSDEATATEELLWVTQNELRKKRVKAEAAKARRAKLRRTK